MIKTIRQDTALSSVLEEIVIQEVDETISLARLGEVCSLYFTCNGRIVESLAGTTVLCDAILIGKYCANEYAFIPDGVGRVMRVNIRDNVKLPTFLLETGALMITEAKEPQLIAQLQEIYNECEMQLPFHEEILGTIVDKFIITLMRKNEGQQFSKKPDDNQTLVMQVKQYIEQNYRDSITLSSLAQRFNMSSSNLSHRFKCFCDIAPINYLINIRIARAKILLATTDMTIQDISMTVGYENTAYFFVLFKKITQETPTDFRLKTRRRM